MVIPPDELQLGQLLVGLKYRPLCEQFSQNAPGKDKQKLNRLSKQNRPDGPSLVLSRTRSSTRRWRACTSLRPGAALVGGTTA